MPIDTWLDVGGDCHENSSNLLMYWVKNNGNYLKYINIVSSCKERKKPLILTIFCDLLLLMNIFADGQKGKKYENPLLVFKVHIGSYLKYLVSDICVLQELL